MSEEPIKALFYLCCSVLEKHAPIKDKGAVVEKFGKFEISMSGEGNSKMEPCRAYIMRNGWPIGIVGPFEGGIMGDEDVLMKEIEEEALAAGYPLRMWTESKEVPE